MKEILTRTATGLLFVGVVISSIVWSQYSVAVLFLLVSILALYEFYKLMNKASFTPHKTIGFICGATIYILIALHSFNWLPLHTLSIIFPLLVGIVIVELFRKQKSPISNIAFTVLSMIYIVMPLASLNYFAYYNPFNDEVHLYKNEYSLLLGFFIIVWSNDTGAYLFGRLFGKRKLFKRISPNKTWEGFIGGAFVAVGSAILFANSTDSSMFHWSIIASLIVIFGTLGDLTESQIKRSIGVKDASNFLPGHGGILDRFDGVLYAAPFVLTYFLIIKAESLI
ncbi:phosphatidate cytidylyltransferase [Flavobacteriales bacterium]|nr:phosphatidate cytidylyltransferase [Flavobacteriales bacterium]MDC3336978.1 phosphatidate cytidylyltransferase [Flavobacteriales bacterium]